MNFEIAADFFWLCEERKTVTDRDWFCEEKERVRERSLTEFVLLVLWA